LLLRKENLQIFPNNNAVKIDFFNDSIVGGKSELLHKSVSDTSIYLTFKLKEGFINPYVIINIACKNDSTIDLYPYNRLQFEIAGNGIKNIIAVIITRNMNYDIGKKMHELYFTGNFEITPNKKLYHLNLGQLKIPDWWYELNNLSPNKKLQPDFRHVLRINFANGSTAINDSTHSLQIFSITFTRDNNAILILFGIVEFIIFLILITMHYFKFYFKRKYKPVTISYKPVEIAIENKLPQNFFDYINNNFHDSNLNLESVAAFAGLSQRKIAEAILQTFNCNFKTYVNQLRINESKRLLLESGLAMGEIAFKVGFNSQSHFNRVFKSIVNVSPTEFRETHH
jgi:AraC-like DNA-binding protein